MVDVGVGAGEQALGVPDAGDGPPGEAGHAGDPGLVAAGGRAGDVLPGVEQLPVVIGLLQDQFQPFDREVLDPARVSAAGVGQGDGGAEVAVLERGGDQAAGPADDEVSKAPAEPPGVDGPGRVRRDRRRAVRRGERAVDPVDELADVACHEAGNAGVLVAGTAAVGGD